MRGVSSDFFLLAGSIVTLAALGLIITRGGRTVQVVNALGRQFTAAIRTATFQ